MATSYVEITPKNVTCHFCSKSRIQVGELSCGHRMCATCFPFYSQKLEKCYICILSTAEVKQTSMKFVHCFANVAEITDASEVQKIFCTNYGCNFIGSLPEIADHKDECALPKPEIMSRASGDSFPPKVSVEGDALKISHSSGIKVFKLSDLCGCPSKIVPSGLSVKAPQNAPAKYSVEISEHVEMDGDPPKSDSFDSNLSTSVIAASDSESDGAAEKGDGVGWELCGDESVGKTTSDIFEPIAVEDDLEYEQVDFEGQVQEPQETVIIPGIRRPAKDKYSFNGLRDLSIVIFMLVFALSVTFLLQPVKNKPLHARWDQPSHYVTWKAGNIADLVANAQFNTKDVKLSDFITVGDYQIRLGVGATHAFNEKAVVLWVTAVVKRNDEESWSRDERMQVRLEHKDPEQAQTYDFNAQQRGSWTENTRIQKRKLLVRQMQVETSPRFKYLRFSYFLTYEQAEAEGFLTNDAVTVGFKLMK